MPKWAHTHSRGAAAPHNPLWPADRDTLYLRVCLLPLSPLGFPLMPCSYCPPPSRSADWLPLPLSCRTCHLPRWRPHTHVINSFSSGLQKYRKFPGGLLHGKEMSVPHCHTLAWIPHYMPHDKGTLSELGGDYAACDYYNNANPRKSRWYLRRDVHTSLFKSFATGWVISHVCNRHAGLRRTGR